MLEFKGRKYVTVDMFVRDLWPGISTEDAARRIRSYFGEISALGRDIHAIEFAGVAPSNGIGFSEDLSITTFVVGMDEEATLGEVTFL